MKVIVSFANPFLVAIYTVSLLLIGFAIGSYYGHLGSRLDAIDRDDPFARA